LDLRRILFLVGVLLFCVSAFAAPWDFFRPVASEVTDAGVFTSWVVFIVSLVIFGISVLALKKSKSNKLIWVSAAFGLFLLKRLLIVIDIYYSQGDFMNNSIQGFFDLLVMISFFVALFRK